MKNLTKVLGSVLSLSAFPAVADMFHYNNVIIGERAQGLGGAYTAIADDASGVYYNPAGLAFAQSNDISGSANAIYDRKIKYKSVFEGQDFTEKSSGTFSPFFGAMQKLDRFLTGLVGGFAYYTLDTELTDQNDLITNAKLSSTSTYNILRRTLNRRGSTTGASLGLGYRIGTNLSLGVSLTYLNSEDLTQSYLMIDQTDAKDGRTVRSQNIREKVTTYGIEPTLGIQWAPSANFAVGMALKKGQTASQKYEAQVHTMILGASGFELANEVKSANPLGSPPIQLRTGVAWFASPEFLMAFDIQHTMAVSDMEGSFKEINKRAAVTNYALGTEYYLSPSLPLRLGLFTNNDARKATSASQLESLNYTGSSNFFGWAQPNSQVSLGYVLQKGVGTGNKAGNGETQKVEAFAYSIGFSATHSF
ncbi:MAG: outer membrane protein transport protein [Proteobacteria bacterium]|nr:outer membrane protein transport protein [Pseudomonadota bacterium]